MRCKKTPKAGLLCQLPRQKRGCARKANGAYGEEYETRHQRYRQTYKTQHHTDGANNSENESNNHGVLSALAANPCGSQYRDRSISTFLCPFFCK